VTRACPNCMAKSIPLSEILFSSCQCVKCGALVGVHWAARFGFSVLIFAVTITTTTMVLVQSGLYAAILWFTLPIGALSYIKARFSPLETKGEGRGA
jgi:uncharacterized protein (DUF983 family)